MSAQPSRTVSVARQFEAEAADVYDAWVKSELARGWLFSTPAAPLRSLELDVRKGGSFNITAEHEGQAIEHRGEYLELQRPRRLVFSFSSSGFEQHPTKVTVEITPFEDGGCSLTLSQEGVPEPYAEAVEAEWEQMLDGLDRVVRHS